MEDFGAGLPFLISIFAVATSRVIALSASAGEEESPDSTEPCTGEQPASCKRERESATENNCRRRIFSGGKPAFAKAPAGKGENVR